MNSNSSNRLDNVMTAEQFTQVVDAILEGKYSWACLLILRFAGYNPLHYIPYRTYNRLMKDHCQKNHKKVANSTAADYNIRQLNPKCYGAEINDLSYLETLNEKSPQVYGGGTLDGCKTSCASSKLYYFARAFLDNIK